MYTNTSNLENDKINMNDIKPKHIKNTIHEEVKDDRFKEKMSQSRIEDSRPNSDLNIQFTDNNPELGGNDSNDFLIIQKIRNLIKNRRKYQAS